MDSIMGGGMRMNRQSSLDTLLDKDNVTLEEVLNDSDILTELKWANARLTNLYFYHLSHPIL
jgi:hypothetical protein